MDIIKQIETYILYLITECGLSVTLHPQREETLIAFSSLMQFNIHDNSYCSYIKSISGGNRRCRHQQKKALERSDQGAFCGLCYAGVFEYVYPIFDGEQNLGFISVSGYGCKEGRGRISAAAEELGCSEKALRKIYGTLREIPEKERIDTLLFPLCSMLELAYRKEHKQEKEESFAIRVIRYVKQRYASDLTTEQLCKKFHCSRSHFSHTFKKETGKTFREYLTETRLEHARRLLRYSGLQVSEIAFSVGFNDANYFSNIFRKKYGISPREYRIKHKP